MKLVRKWKLSTAALIGATAGVIVGQWRWMTGGVIYDFAPAMVRLLGHVALGALIFVIVAVLRNRFLVRR